MNFVTDSVIFWGIHTCMFTRSPSQQDDFCSIPSATIYEYKCLCFSISTCTVTCSTYLHWTSVRNYVYPNFNPNNRHASFFICSLRWKTHTGILKVKVSMKSDSTIILYTRRITFHTFKIVQCTCVNVWRKRAINVVNNAIQG